MTLTLIDAAARLGVSPDNLRGALRRGALRGTKIGRDWTVTETEVERYRRESLGRPGRRPAEMPGDLEIRPETTATPRGGAGGRSRLWQTGAFDLGRAL